jgi:hypothetical protein
MEFQLHHNQFCSPFLDLLTNHVYEDHSCHVYDHNHFDNHGSHFHRNVFESELSLSNPLARNLNLVRQYLVLGSCP